MPGTELSASARGWLKLPLHEDNLRVYEACHMLCPEPALGHHSYSPLLQYEVRILALDQPLPARDESRGCLSFWCTVSHSKAATAHACRSSHI